MSEATRLFLARGRQRRGGESHPFGCAPWPPSKTRTSYREIGFAEVGFAPSSARPPGARSPKGGWVPSTRTELGARAHRRIRVAVSLSASAGFERFVSARIASRLQRSVRNIFLTFARETARSTERARGSTAEPGDVTVARASPGRKGVEEARRARTEHPQSFPSVARSRLEPKEGVLGRMTEGL